MSAVCYCLFNISAATLHIGGLSSIRNLRMHLSVVTGTHLSLPLAESFYQLLCSDFRSGSYIDSKLLHFIYLHYSLGGAAMLKHTTNVPRNHIYAHPYALLASSVPVRNFVLTYITTNYKTLNLYLGQGFLSLLGPSPKLGLATP
jgi:hypothetical protein